MIPTRNMLTNDSGPEIRNQSLGNIHRHIILTNIHRDVQFTHEIYNIQTRGTS